MPGRNIYKDYLPDSYYHVFNRGVNKQRIFHEDVDYAYFLKLLKRYLGTGASKRTNSTPHPSFKDKMELLAFCLMPNHYHLLIYQKSDDGMKLLLKSLGVSYSMYFNNKYKRVGPLFQQRYRASLITSDSYLTHISRYIHINPEDYKSWQWSSLPYYTGQSNAEWLKPDRIIDFFGAYDYLQFIEEFEDHRADLNIIKHELANS